MDANARAYYLRRALQEQHAAREATVAEVRRRHEQLAIAYELRCLMDARSNGSTGIATAHPVPASV